MNPAIHLPFESEHPKSDRLADLKKAAIGIAYTFGLEIIFFGGAVLAVYLLWNGFTSALHVSDKQHMYLYNQYEVKYLAMVYVGAKKRKAIKCWLRRNKIHGHR